MKNLTLHLHLAVSLCGQKAPKRHISKAKKIKKKKKDEILGEE